MKPFHAKQTTATIIKLTGVYNMTNTLL